MAACRYRSFFYKNSRGIPYLYFFVFQLNERMVCEKEQKKVKKDKITRPSGPKDKNKK